MPSLTDPSFASAARLPSEGAPEDAARVTCEHAQACGGCPIIALGYGEQLVLKRGKVVASLTRYPSLELVYTDPVAPAEPITSYRTRAKLIVAPGGKVGLFAKGGGHQVVDIPGCRVLSPAVLRVSERLRAMILRDEASRGPLAPFEAAGPPSSESQRSGGHGALRAVDLREVREQGEHGPARVLVTFVVQRGRGTDADVLAKAARELASEAPEVLAVAANFHEGEAPQILGSETVVLHGPAAARDRLGASVHLATFGSFVQAHRGQAARVHAILAEALGAARAKERGRPLSRPRSLRRLRRHRPRPRRGRRQVHLVESFAPAVAHATEAAEEQGLPLTAEHADVATALRTIGQRGERFDAVVTNPPRSGMSATAREWLARLEPQIIAYVSCDPDTLARDLDHLARARLHRRPSSAPRHDPAHRRGRDRRGAPARAGARAARGLRRRGHVHRRQGPARADDAAGRVRELAPLRALGRFHGAENAVPVHRIDIGTSGLVVLAKDAAFVSAWQGVLSAEQRRGKSTSPRRAGSRRRRAPSPESSAKTASSTPRARATAGSPSRPATASSASSRSRGGRTRSAVTSRPSATRSSATSATGTCRRTASSRRRTASTAPSSTASASSSSTPKTGARLIVEAPLPGDLRAVLERTSGPGTLRFLDHKNALGTSSGGGSRSSSLPPRRLAHERGSALDVDASSPTIHPELTGDDEDVGGRDSGEF